LIHSHARIEVDRLLPWRAGASAKAAEDDGKLIAEGARHQAAKPHLLNALKTTRSTFAQAKK